MKISAMKISAKTISAMTIVLAAGLAASATLALAQTSLEHASLAPRPTSAASPQASSPQTVSERTARDIAWSAGLVHIEEIELLDDHWTVAGRSRTGEELALDIDARDGSVRGEGRRPWRDDDTAIAR